jgi:hypothetical protein
MTNNAASTSLPDADGQADTLVRVRRRWYNRKIGTVRLLDLEGFHWAPAGRGRYGRNSARWFLHAYMLCTKIVAGAVGHSCQHGPPPHRIRVCLTKKDNGAAYVRLAALPRRPPPTRKRAVPKLQKS